MAISKKIILLISGFVSIVSVFLAIALIISGLNGYVAPLLLFSLLAFIVFVPVFVIYSISLFLPTKDIMKEAYVKWCEKRKKIDLFKYIKLEKEEKALLQAPAVIERSWALSPPSSIVQYFMHEGLIWHGCDVILTDQRIIFLWITHLFSIDSKTFSIWYAKPSKDGMKITCVELRKEGDQKFVYFRFKHGITSNYIKLFYYPKPGELIRRFAGVIAK